MNEIILLNELRDRGLDHPDIRRMIRTGELERVRRGAFARPTPADATIQEKHRVQVHATAPFLSEGTAISHGSAAALHRLPVWRASLRRVHATRARDYGGRCREHVHLHPAPLPPEDLVMVDGVLTTSLARTVADLGRTTPLPQSVAAGDRALAIGLSPEELAEALARMERWPGVRRARVATGMLDPRSESAGESATRVELILQGLPRPDLQVKIVDRRGKVIARCDVGWEEQRTVGEFDGKIKYGRLLKPGQTVEDVVYEEKLREDAIRDEGWQVVRWTWDDLARPEVMRDRVLRAFQRSAPAGPSAPIS